MASENIIDQLDQELAKQADPSKTNMLNGLTEESNVYEKRDRVGEIADKIFLELDSDKDGFITLEEFRDGALKMPMVINLLDNCFD